MRTPKIAIIGAGFCGMACAYYLSQSIAQGASIEVTIFDPSEVGDNASGISAGLLHTYHGAHAKFSQRGAEGTAATLKLIKAAESAAQIPIAAKTGMLRIAVTEEQKHDFKTCAQLCPDVKWLNPHECQALLPSLAPNPGIWIESGYVVKTKPYLEGLWKVCEERGVCWKKTKMTSIHEIGEYDAIIVAPGASITGIKEFSLLPIRPVKGQVLILRWPEGLSPLTFPVNSKAYLVPGDTPKSCIVGATFERRFSDEKPNTGQALDYLKPKMSELIPELEFAEVISCFAGLRASTPSHTPLAERYNKNTWILTGMGSKGLLYHALLAQEITEEIIRAVLHSFFS